VSFHAQASSQSSARSHVDLWASRELASAPNQTNYQHSYSFMNRSYHNSGNLDILGQRTSLAAISDGICEAGD
jgi:hypothetical protein